MPPNICPNCGGHGPGPCLIHRFYTGTVKSPSNGFWASDKGAWEAFRRAVVYLHHHFREGDDRTFDVMSKGNFRLIGGWVFPLTYARDSVQHADDPILQWVYAGDNGIFHLIGDEWDW